MKEKEGIVREMSPIAAIMTIRTRMGELKYLVQNQYDH
jgi:hypothetical protein